MVRMVRHRPASEEDIGGPSVAGKGVANEKGPDAMSGPVLS